jgi:hypothetical protein
MGSLNFPKYSLGRLLWAMVLAAVGLSVMVKSGTPSVILFAAKCIVIGTCFGAAIGLIVDRPKLFMLIDAGLWLLFALYATLA